MKDQSSPESPGNEGPVIDVELSQPEMTTTGPEAMGATDNTPMKKRRSTKTRKERPVKGAEVAVVQSGPLSIPKKGTTLLDIGVRPEEVIDIGVEIANSLKKIIERPGNLLYTEHKGKKHVHVEGWTTMGAMLGIFPREIESREIKQGCWETKVEIVKVSDGKVIGAASHICSRAERNWKNRDEYAIKSMSATRATGKAFRIAFSWVMVLAGYSPTPEEEMRFNEETGEKDPFDGKPAREVKEEVKKKPVVEKPDPDTIYTASNKHKIQLAAMFTDVGLFDRGGLSLISDWLVKHELSFKHCGDLIYLLKRYRITKSDLPVVANNLIELDIPQVEEMLIQYSAGGSDA